MRVPAKFDLSSAFLWGLAVAIGLGLALWDASDAPESETFSHQEPSTKDEPIHGDPVRNGYVEDVSIIWEDAQ